MINPYYHPNPYYRYGTRAVGSATALAGAYNIAKQRFAPLVKDLKSVYDYGRRKFIAGKAARYKKPFRGKKYKSFPKKVKSQIKELKRLAESDMGTLVYRNMLAYDLKVSSVNQQNNISLVGSDSGELENVIAQLRYYNPSAPSSLVTADGATGSYQKEFYFKRSYGKITLRNNYQVPCKLKVYCCAPKEDTSITPGTAWSQGLTDSSNVATTAPNVFPTDSPQFNDLWKIISSHEKTLSPGSEVMFMNRMKQFQYDPSLQDDHALTYQSRNQSFSWLVCVRGVIGHDTVLDQQGLLLAGVDILLERVFEVRYSAGADIRYTYCTNSLSSFTNGPVVSSKPVSDNINYSVA